MDLIQYLKTDDEMKNLRAKWKETFVTPFPPYNWDEYNGIEGYKEKIRNKLKIPPVSRPVVFLCPFLRKRG